MKPTRNKIFMSSLFCAMSLLADAVAGEIEEEVDSLLKKMTIEEKVALWHGCSGMEAGGIERLNIPRVKMTDGPQGVRGAVSTYFPTGIAMAACWNEELMKKVGAALGRETRASGCSVLLGPGINIMRTPLGGRSFEYFGEDPLLAGKIATAYVRGIQSENVAACVKHLVGNNQEKFRTVNSSKIGERALREIYLPAFEMACQEGNTWSIMSAYNQVNGTYASANKYIQQEIPKEEWGWNGAMISDWGGAHDWKGCATGGLDIIMPGPAHGFANPLLEAVKNGEISEDIIDDHARRSLRLILRTRPTKQQQLNAKANTKDHQALARELARESIVLLKNDGQQLPFSIASLKSIAVIGPNSDKQHSMDGVAGSGGSGAVNPPYEITPLQGIEALVGGRVKINFAEGFAFGGGMKVVSTKYLTSKNRRQNGLDAEYFANMNLEGKPVTRQVDSTVNFNWTSQVAMEGLPADRFSVRWSGKLTAPVSGEYIIGTESDDGSRLFIDGQLIVDSWGHHAMEQKSGKAILKKGKKYDIRLEYYDAGGNAAVKLLWKLPQNKDEMFAEAIKAAKESEVAVVFAGINHSYDREALGWGDVPNADRPDMELIGPQVELIEAVAAVNPNTVVVMIGGGPLRVEKWHSKVRAVLMAWYPGLEGGHALAEVLFGQVNPSGKLVSTWGKQLDDYACHSNGNYPGNIEEVEYDEGIWVGYRHFEKQNIVPRYPFGFGLSYTDFQISDLEVPEVMMENETLRIRCKVSNIGSRAGSEVVQLYIGDEESSVARPVKELKGFMKTRLAAGETKELEFEIDRRALSFYDVDKAAWVAEPGRFTVYVGSSVVDIEQTGAFTLKQR